MSASSVAPSYAVKKALLGGGISLLLLTVSACGGKEAADTASAPSAAPATSTSSPSSAPATRESNGIPIKGPAKNVNGKYLQTTLKPDDPIIATFDPKFVTGDAVDTFTSDELREAVRVAEVFTAEEGIDSILNGSNDPAGLPRISLTLGVECC